jgi:hypothetical protein
MKRIAGIVIMALGLVTFLSAGVSHAATPWPVTITTNPCVPSHSTEVVTSLTNRPDSGGNGNWANDHLTRTFAYNLVSTSGGVFSYTGVLCDSGTYTTIPGAFAPNQGPGFTGLRITGDVTATVSDGFATFEFSSTTAANPALMPASQDGSGFSTSNWPAQLFTADAATVNLDNDWTWTYTDPAHKACPTCGEFLRQNWVDSAADGGGQDPGSGEIYGS